MKIKLLLLCGWLTLGWFALALAEAEAPARSLDELETRLEQLLEEHAVPGMRFTVISPEGIRATGLGLADRAGERPATAETCFRQGSISKSFVSLAVLELAEGGWLELEAPVHTLLPDSGARRASD